MKRFSWDELMNRYPALFAILLLVVALIINFILQPNMFARDTLNSNMRVFLPMILLAAGQAIVILGGGIDISVGGIVSIVNTILATQVGLNGSPEKMWTYVFVSLGAGILAGAINGFFIAFLRLQPIITTYATSFLYVGFALFILPNPGGGIPAAIANVYRNTTPLGLPLAFYVIAVVLLIWMYVRSTRFGNYLYAVGGNAEAAYETAVPVTWVLFSTYVVSGFMAALAGIAITMLSGSGNAEIGVPMTLTSITAVVIGGTALSGGVGGVAGPVVGAITLGIIQNIISFSRIDTWWETFVKATIIVVALAAPGIINLLRRKKV
ncbi:monosaccharide ABC transporter membrane protein, CUT2 family [Bellilinea caldifistulae]|uniref:ABC transporter permease n=1 Tax=Bellilinea caldifistulae TaxID=360411 RepID=A0A0P6WTQ6_9CHLR|nr:ABC transporter permease [Bellilinea caldifistulae]KPL73636.1 ABC transporter permease [Bellilinea caldifistulae]GAP10274.1 monosaccharide ABC transporter membrane protein, CUT2 family [Bellilinea caldifistulae]